jgi:hypothetical protein
MTAIRIHKTLDSTTVDLPELAPLVGRRVELIVREEADRIWPVGWFDAVEGAIQDPTFERPPQPEASVRPLLDP